MLNFILQEWSVSGWSTVTTTNSYIEASDFYHKRPGFNRVLNTELDNPIVLQPED